MASVVMPTPPSITSPTMTSSPRKSLKRSAPSNGTHAIRAGVPTIRGPGAAPPKSPMLAGDKTLPSQLPRTPASANPWSAGIRNDDMKTPITPPSAYSDFLQALSPAMSTPGTARSAFSNFSFTDRSGHLTPITQPPSAASASGNVPNESKRRAPPPAPLPLGPPTSVATAPLVPPSPFVRPTIQRQNSLTARTPTTLKKLTIPDSPSFSPATDSANNSAAPRSATQTRSAGALIPASAVTTSRSPYPTSAELRSPFSPTSWYQEGRTRHIVEPKSRGTQTVQVRQVITRTVTYTPLEPAPKRRRRMREGEAPTPIDPRMHQWPTHDLKTEVTVKDDLSESDLTGSTVSSSDPSEQGSVSGHNDEAKTVPGVTEPPAITIDQSSDGEAKVDS